MTNNLFVLRHKESQLFVGRDHETWFFKLTNWLGSGKALFFETIDDPELKDILVKKNWDWQYKMDFEFKFEFELVEVEFSVVKTVTLDNQC